MSLAVRSPGSRDGKDAVGIPVDHQRGHIDAGQSARKSSCQVGTHARLAVAEALAATFQLAWTACSLTRLPRITSVL